MNILKINGQALEGIYVDAAISFNKPAKRVSTYSVPGRNGDLVIDEGTFDNVLITYPVFEKGTFPTKFVEIVNYLASLEGYQRIECSNDPQHYRLGRFVVPQNPTAKRLNRDGYWQLSFDCKPQRWLLSGEEDTEIDANPIDEYSGDIVSFDAVALDEITELKTAIEPVQIGTGDPSPTNVRPIIGWDKAHILQSQLADISAANGRLIFPWKDGNTEYNPEMNLCLVTDAELADSSTVHGAFFEWDKTVPFGVPFDEPEAIYYFDGTEGTGDKYITIGKNYGTGWIAGQSIQITLTSAPANGDQLVINCGTNNVNNPTNGRAWNVYAKGATTSKQSGTTSQGTSGTKLGETDSTDVGKTNGCVNAPQRVVYGYNRWSQSLLRQYLNATVASGWYSASNPWDRPNATAVAREGFLYGYGEDVYSHFKPIKVVTVACNADSNVEDVTYDRVFLSSLEQMYCVPQFSGKEGSYWEYYKRLLGRTSPAPTSATYARLIKYALNAPTSAQYCWRRSAARDTANYAWRVNTSGTVNAHGAYYAYRCAPSVFISAEDIKITDITWSDAAGTVYGGTLNVTTGVLTIDRVMYSGDALTWEASGAQTYANRFYAYIGNTIVSGDVAAQEISDQFVHGWADCMGFSSTAQPYKCAVYSGQLYITIDKSVSTKALCNSWMATNKPQFLLKLATPTTVQLTAAEVELLLGQNNIWADTGDVEVKVTTPTVFNNPSLFNSKPLIRVYGVGTFRVNDITVTIASHDKPYIDIDCELQECYYGSENMNEYVSFSGNDFPELQPGDNYMLLASGITKLDVTPRWWVL